MRKLVIESDSKTFSAQEAQSMRFYASVSPKSNKYVSVIKRVFDGCWTLCSISNSCWFQSDIKAESMEELLKTLHSEGHLVCEFDTAKEMLLWCIDQL